MYNDAFVTDNTGRGAALAVILFLGVLPLVGYNVVQLRRESGPTDERRNRRTPSAVPSTGAAAAKDHPRTAFSSSGRPIVSSSLHRALDDPDRRPVRHLVPTGEDVANSGWWTVSRTRPSRWRTTTPCCSQGRDNRDLAATSSTRSPSRSRRRSSRCYRVDGGVRAGLGAVQGQRHACSSSIFALQVVPLQMALVPLLRFYNLGVHIGERADLPGAASRAGRTGRSGSRTRCSRCRWRCSCCTTSSPSCPRPDRGGAGRRREPLPRSSARSCCRCRRRRSRRSRSSSSSGCGTTCSSR